MITGVGFEGLDLFTGHAERLRIAVEDLDVADIPRVGVVHFLAITILDDLAPHLLIRALRGHVHQAAREDLGEEGVRQPLDGEVAAGAGGVGQQLFGQRLIVGLERTYRLGDDLQEAMLVLVGRESRLSHLRRRTERTSCW